VGTFKREFSEAAIGRAGNAPIKDVLLKHVDLIGGMKRYIKHTDTVFIKPNLTAGMPSESGGTTDVYFTEAVVELVKEAGAARIIVGECSGNDSRSIESLTNLGYADMCARQGVEMADLDFTEFVEAPVKNPKYKDTLRLPKIFLESDVYISVPVLKTHLAAGITCAIKNSFGLIPDYDKLYAHRDQAIEKIISDIASVKPADLVFIDGRIGAEGIAGGNDFDHPIQANLVIVSNDPVAADTVAAQLMCQNPRVKHIQWAAEEGAGNDRLEFILIRGLSIDEAKVKYMSPADQIVKDTEGRVRINECGACSRCCTNAAGMVSRYAHNPASLLEPVEIVTGPGEWIPPDPPAQNTLLLGDCVREEYRKLGKWIGGCPVDPEAYAKALAELDIVCTKCERMVKSILAEIEEDELADIRVLASNKTVFQGKNNKAEMDDYMLAIGRCQAGYVKGHARRIHKVSDIDAAEYTVFKDGCPVSGAEIREGIRELRAKMKVERRK
jgi:uncharacterized protein (DUF362 family)